MSDANRPQAATLPGPDEVVTLIVKHRVKAGQEQPYEAWLRRIVRVAGAYEGHLGVDVIRGKSAGLDLFTCVLRFCSTAAMQRWLESPQRQALVDEAAPMLADGDRTEVHPRNEFWFALPTDAAAPPPRWKQALLTYLVICPMTMVIPQLLAPLFARFPQLGGPITGNLVVNLFVILPVVFYIMPWVTRRCANWLRG